jgi:hypothetical protein
LAVIIVSRTEIALAQFIDLGQQLVLLFVRAHALQVLQDLVAAQGGRLDLLGEHRLQTHVRTLGHSLAAGDANREVAKPFFGEPFLGEWLGHHRAGVPGDTLKAPDARHQHQPEQDENHCEAAAQAGSDTQVVELHRISLAEWVSSFAHISGRATRAKPVPAW